MSIKLLFKLCIFFLLLSTAAEAQMERFRIAPRHFGIKIRPELKILGGFSLPQGQYAALTDVSDEKGAARMGYFGEIRILQRSPVKPLWSLQLSLGYMQHQVDAEKIMDEFNLVSFQSDLWQHFYAMPGVAFRGGRRMRFELNAAAGIWVYQGFNISRGVYGKNQQLDVYAWEYPRSVGGALRLGAMLGFKINKRWTIFAETDYYLGRGRREGTRYNHIYNVDPVQLFAIDPPVFALEQTVFDTVVLNVFNIGIGIKYRAYKYLYDPNRRHWNYY